MNRLFDIDLAAASALRRDFLERLEGLAQDLVGAIGAQSEFDLEWEGEQGSQVRDGILHCHVRVHDRYYEFVAYDAEFQLREPLEDIWATLEMSIKNRLVV